MTETDLEGLRFDAAGLIPAIVQGRAGDVRMLGYMNRESLALTRSSGLVTFFSRSRGKLWMKGEESGHTLRVLSLTADCDRDALLVIAEPIGNTCHLGRASCFGAEPPQGTAFFARLEEVLGERRTSASAERSYTQRLFAAGTDRIAKKVVEEAGEVILAAKNLDRERTAAGVEAFLGEAADLMMHLELLLVAQGASLAEVAEVLRLRHLRADGAAPGGA